MTTSVTSPVTPERIMQFAWGYVPPLVLEAAIRHRVFDLLDGGPKTLAEVQKESGASQRGLAAVMNALVGMGLLAKDKQGLFSLTPESSAFLVSTKPGFQGGLLLHGSEQLIPKWLHLNRIVETGRPRGVGQPRRRWSRLLSAIRRRNLPPEFSRGANSEPSLAFEWRRRGARARSGGRFWSVGHRDGAGIGTVAGHGCRLA